MCKEKEQLKIDLQRIKANKYNLNGDEQVRNYVDLMLKYIGDSDPELRDDLIYLTFVYWIEEKNYFTNEELISLLNKILSEEFAFYNIGSDNDDSVLRRSFSILLINPILCVHLDKDFLDENMILKTKNCLIRYFNEEKDWRGYDEKKGWLHALAHAADGMHVLANCKGITKEICKEIMVTIENLLCKGRYVFSAEEYERLMTIIYDDVICDNLLEEEYVCNWIEGLGRVLGIEDNITKFRARANVKNAMRSVYFRVIHNNGSERILKSIVDLDKKLNVYVN